MSPVTSPTKPPYQSPKRHFQGGKPIPPTLLQKSAEDWELHPCQIVVENKLGQGGFGDVYQGTIRGGVGIYKSNGPPIMRVAVKILRGRQLAHNTTEIFLLVETVEKFCPSHTLTCARTYTIHVAL